MGEVYKARDTLPVSMASGPAKLHENGEQQSSFDPVYQGAGQRWRFRESSRGPTT